MINNIVTINKIAAFAINFSFALIIPWTVILGTTREEATIPYYAFRMKIKYALVKVLMLVGDVRNAMVAMGTSGTKDVLAHLPDDAYKRRTKCFDHISVARKEGNCALLDVCLKMSLIGSDRA
jgi:hypothetical protein